MSYKKLKQQKGCVNFKMNKHVFFALLATEKLKKKNSSKGRFVVFYPPHTQPETRQTGSSQEDNAHATLRCTIGDLQAKLRCSSTRNTENMHKATQTIRVPSKVTDITPLFPIPGAKNFSKK